jgi:hypothetical protein
MFSSIVAFALVGPRPVYSRITLTTEVAIFAEGLWFFGCWSMRTPFSRILRRVLAPREGEEALEPRRQRSLEPTPRQPVVVGGSFLLPNSARGFGAGRRFVIVQFFNERDRALHAKDSRAGPRKGGASMTRSAPLSSDLSQEQVEAMMEQGMAFSDVEDLIDASQLSALHKAALWLLAWSLRDVEHQREDARLTLAAVGAGELGGW